jgi:hypothetical protein
VVAWEKGPAQARDKVRVVEPSATKELLQEQEGLVLQLKEEVRSEV